MAIRVAYRQPQTGGQGFSRTKKVLGGTTALATTDVNQTTNSVALFRVPAGFIATGIYAVATDMDTGTPALTFNLGDAGNASRFLAGSTIGQAGTSVAALAAAGLYYEFTADTDILLACGVAAATAAAGSITVYLEGFMK